MLALTYSSFFIILFKQGRLVILTAVISSSAAAVIYYSFLMIGFLYGSTLSPRVELFQQTAAHFTHKRHKHNNSRVNQTH